MFPIKFQFIWRCGYRGEDFFKSTNQKQELPMTAICLLTDRDEMCNLYREPSIDASYQVCSFGQVVSEEKIFLNRPIRNKNCLWHPCLLMDRDKICAFFIDDLP